MLLDNFYSLIVYVNIVDFRTETVCFCCRLHILNIIQFLVMIACEITDKGNIGKEFAITHQRHIFIHY